MQMFGRLREVIRGRNHLREMISREKTHGMPLSLTKKIWAWKRGFLTESYYFYQLDRNSPQDYVTDYMRYVKTPHINGSFREALNNKLIFDWMIRRIRPDLLPELYGILLEGKLHLSDTQESIDAVTWLEEQLRAGKQFVLKPHNGGGGIGIAMLFPSERGYTINGKLAGQDELKRLVSHSHQFIVTEYIQQAEYSARIFPGAANTIRILTMWDVDRNEPFIAIATHRFGTTSSSPVDNFDRGGLSVKIDTETGTMGMGAAYQKPELKWYDCHPETNQTINGLVIPHWESIRESVLHLAQALPYLPYIGWDLISVDGSFKVLEGNSYSGMLLQMHEPLLKDQRVRKFYQRYGVIPAS
jgi:hypothetical protein